MGQSSTLITSFSKKKAMLLQADDLWNSSRSSIVLIRGAGDLQN